MAYQFNEYQSTIEDLKLDSYPKEVQEQFYDFINNVPFIKHLISKDRPRAKDRPRDDQGRIIVDLARPHILEDVDYFRQAAITYQKTGQYTSLRPNPNPNSEYMKWAKEEVRRCYEGMVRPSDGEWVTGNMYFFMNYCPIPQTKTKKGSKKGQRVTDFPEFWEGIYWRYHYIEQAQYGGIYSIPKNDSVGGDNGCEISSRGKSKSLTMSAIMAKYFVLGESAEVRSEVKCLATAYQKQYLNSDGILNKFVSYIDFLAENTQWPHKRLKNSLPDMAWRMGFLDLDTGVAKGTLNEVIGLSAKDDISKIRGKRMHFIVVEEFGSFRNVLELYNIMIPSVQEGDISFGLLYLIGTSGDKESDFQGASEIVYNPKGYRMYGIPNVFDIEGQGKNLITFFFPGYINRKGCYDSNGTSDVTKALLEILDNRFRVKYNSSDINSITKTIAEIPITPQEAILRTRGNMFPVTQLNERVTQLDNNPSEYDDVYVGDLAMDKSGEIKFIPTSELPIRMYPLKDNKAKGAIEIFKMPERDRDGKVYANRYILGHDPVDDDTSTTMSLTSTFVLDLWTDKIVAEWTGRLDFADDNFERVRLMCLFYNGRCLYEQNKKGIFAYFSRMNCLYLLADTPEYLRDKDLVKGQMIGNKAKGVNATAPINNYANSLIKNWLINPVPTIITNDAGEDIEISISNLYFIRNRALLQELILFNPDINVDRIRALGMVMLYREEKVIMYQGNMSKEREDKAYKNYLGKDDFFSKNYDAKFMRKSKF